ncbi:MAG: 4-hydroxy-tetrahydrodipicolinate synthase [Algoriphagus sp.]|jgi:4-hydroxy-tetrahydrodipicolinate synthase|uniref:4-hydroxy-tetrahydrodipicolinate synthase n=1 Tax=Algoriphagus sp. TaxID=1872435 RepID=UPI00277615E6|nr:4-hydroxy-tetrahydrodipicolinate synthase [Algoriphagus sp.]MDP4748588.1 4-hydroxy-tetrahydrodipicolinate synthase [Algoriphagus sp.]MDP4839492.1 4-hydroxy-tetrahydrodipicolinate synthase [Algoriphagus sp.]MDP4905524.1 4-hydroxy-tetrahydrodipicolinate synthase [Algoriphagus sp.]
MTHVFKGTGVALVTPLLENQEIDFESLKHLIDHVIQGGVDYLVALGTTGESATLTKLEKAKVLKACVQYNNGRVPLMVGIGGNATQKLVEEIEETDFEGISGILSVSPYYNKPTQEGIIAHYRALAEVSPLPLLLYNIPGRTMSNITAETTLTLSQHPTIIGIKEASGNLEQCLQIALAKPKDFLLLSGDDLLTKPIQSLGGTGVISVLANALPATFKQILEGDTASSLAATHSLVELNSLMYQEGNPVGIKNLLFHLGILQTDQVRLPLLRASQSLSEKIRMAKQP